MITACVTGRRVLVGGMNALRAVAVCSIDRISMTGNTLESTANALVGLRVGEGVSVNKIGVVFTPLAGSVGETPTETPNVDGLIGVGVWANKMPGGVGVTVPPPNTDVGKGDPAAIKVRSGEGVKVGNGVGVGSKRNKLVAIQPS